VSFWTFSLYVCDLSILPLICLPPNNERCFFFLGAVFSLLRPFFLLAFGHFCAVSFPCFDFSSIQRRLIVFFFIFRFATPRNDSLVSHLFCKSSPRRVLLLTQAISPSRTRYFFYILLAPYPQLFWPVENQISDFSTLFESLGFFFSAKSEFYFV